MPIQFTVSTSTREDGRGGASTWTLHFPDEIVEIAAAAERVGEQVVVFCRDTQRARTLGQLMLNAEVSSAVLPPTADGRVFRDVLDAFAHSDFAVLLLTDAHNCGWVAPATCRRVLHADLPVANHSTQLLDALADRASRLDRHASSLERAAS